MIDRQPGSGRPRSVCVNENNENAEDLVLGQEDNPTKTFNLWDLMKLVFTDRMCTEYFTVISISSVSKRTYV